MHIFYEDISIRVSGIDAPEIRGDYEKEKQLAIKARDFAKEFVNQGKVTLKKIDRGKYFRIVADENINSKSLAQELIKKA